MTLADLPSLDGFDGDVQVAIRIVREAKQVARSLESRPHTSTKPDSSPVTVADLAIQAIAAERLGAACPGVGLIAEEDASSLADDPDLSRQIVETVGQIVPGATIERVADWIGEAGSRDGSRCWTLDPIDGTKGFIHGRQYVIALALVVGAAAGDLLSPSDPRSESKFSTAVSYSTDINSYGSRSTSWPSRVATRRTRRRSAAATSV